MCTFAETLIESILLTSHLEKAFELYSECHIPYAYYRVGEAYQYGRGVEMDLEKAKFNYRIAYKHGHPLARKKLATFNFFTNK